ncbi:OTU domain [Trinorchestia longiramus]|nr:OTU domain [Trinorchestia longiramus]
MNTNFLQQHVNEPTRGNNILGLVMTTADLSINGLEVTDKIGDHQMIDFSLEVTSILHQITGQLAFYQSYPKTGKKSSSNPIYTHVGSSLDDVTKSLNATLAHTLADGHCFLHAVALQLNETLNSIQAYKFLMKAIETESTRNKNHYRNFIDENSGRLDLLVQKYLHSKIFDHAAGDLILQITSNALQKPIHIYSERDGGIWKTITSAYNAKEHKQNPFTSPSERLPL